MGTYWRLLHIFAVLLLCDYGMFSTPTPSSTERTTIQISNTSDSNTIVTAESTIFGNFTEADEDDELDDERPEPPTNASHENASVPNITVNKSEGLDRSSVEATPRTARPESTTHRRIPLAPPRQRENDSGSYTGGVVILIIILILIVLLLGILYFLRKKGRSYSFDLTRADGPANDYDTPLRSEHQGISYEQTNKDLPVSLDYVHEDKPEEKSSPKANGCAGEKTEQTPANGNEEQNSPEENSFTSSSCSTPPMKKVEFNLDLDLIGGDYELNDLSLSAADVPETPQNQNNNNLFNAGRGSAEEIFTEISLDEPKQHA
ncbi:uncharacterized protein LOC120471076 isoform X1 [Pimephales promelas]|uniref:uncharacterized protein LOC120471076 isoform X1 n=1 Tax=Pimephales promelas TaxID=90988 RepID=UPI001955BF25|nr:uncharacterized protein LOC120471076 isoform X1 [Pimephales promelas]